MFSDHDKTSPSIAAVSAPSAACSMLAVQQQKKLICRFVDVSAAWRGCHMMRHVVQIGPEFWQPASRGPRCIPACVPKATCLTVWMSLSDWLRESFFCQQMPQNWATRNLTFWPFPNCALIYELLCWHSCYVQLFHCLMPVSSCIIVPVCGGSHPISACTDHYECIALYDALYGASSLQDHQFWAVSVV